MHTYDNGFHPKEVKLKPNYKFYNRNFFFRIIEKLLIFLTTILCIFPKYILWGFKVTGKKNLKGLKGAITISNHVLVQDAFCTVTTMLPRKLYVTMLESNLGFPIVSQYLRFVGAVPIPNDKRLMVRFLKETKEIIAKGNFVHIYPEAALMPYCDHIRNFMPGAFHIAYQANCPIIPMVFTFHKPRGFYFYKRKPCIHLNILKPYYPDFTLNRKEGTQKMHTELNKIMTDYFLQNSEILTCNSK